MATPAVPGTPVTPELRERFRRLAEEWRDRSRHMSNTKHMAMLPSYQEIIAMGPAVVPLILEELQRDPNQWFWALKEVTGADPVPHEARGIVQAMADAWVAWGKRHGYLPE